MATLQEFLHEGRDAYVLEAMGWFLLAVGALMILLDVLNVQAPYGRYGDNKGLLSTLLLTNVKVPARVGWFIMEMPSFVIPLYLVLNVGGKQVGELNPNIVLLGMFLLHYFNRVFLFSLSIKGKPTPISTALFALTFTTLNGYMQGRYLSHYYSYDPWWFADPRFVLGHLIFLLGMAANIHSDSILKGLRKPGDIGYKIPQGGLFEYVSGANYFSESLEWTGYAIASWSWAGLVMAAFTTMFLGTRALQHHRFYLKKFEHYPKDRKAFIPFVL